MGLREYLGEVVTYSVTGCEGTCIGVAEYRNGVKKLLITFNDTTGRPCEWWIDKADAIL